MAYFFRLSLISIKSLSVLLGSAGAAGSSLRILLMTFISQNIAQATIRKSRHLKMNHT